MAVYCQRSEVRRLHGLCSNSWTRELLPSGQTLRTHRQRLPPTLCRCADQGLGSSTILLWRVACITIRENRLWYFGIGWTEILGEIVLMMYPILSYYHMHHIPVQNHIFSYCQCRTLLKPTSQALLIQSSASVSSSFNTAERGVCLHASMDGQRMAVTWLFGLVDHPTTSAGNRPRGVPAVRQGLQDVHLEGTWTLELGGRRGEATGQRSLYLTIY